MKILLLLDIVRRGFLHPGSDCGHYARCGVQDLRPSSGTTEWKRHPQRANVPDRNHPGSFHRVRQGRQRWIRTWPANRGSQFSFSKQLVELNFTDNGTVQATLAETFDLGSKVSGSYRYAVVPIFYRYELTKNNHLGLKGIVAEVFMAPETPKSVVISTSPKTAMPPPVSPKITSLRSEKVIPLDTIPV